MDCLFNLSPKAAVLLPGTAAKTKLNAGNKPATFQNLMLGNP